MALSEKDRQKTLDAVIAMSKGLVPVVDMVSLAIDLNDIFDRYPLSDMLKGKPGVERVLEGQRQRHAAIANFQKRFPMANGKFEVAHGTSIGDTIGSLAGAIPGIGGTIAGAVATLTGGKPVGASGISYQELAPQVMQMRADQAKQVIQDIKTGATVVPFFIKKKPEPAPQITTLPTYQTLATSEPPQPTTTTTQQLKTEEVKNKKTLYIILAAVAAVGIGLVLWFKKKAR